MESPHAQLEATELQIPSKEVAEDRGHTEAPSPFLSGTNIQFAWDSTSLGWLKTCPRFYYYQMIEGWSPRGEAIHLRFGIEYHQALQDYDLSRAAGIDHNDSVHDTTRLLLERIHSWDPSPRTKSEELKTKPNLIRTVVWYLDHFKNDSAATFIMDDGRPAVEVSFKFELDWGPQVSRPLAPDHPSDDAHLAPVGQPYLLCGHLDRVVNYQDNLFVMDRKTTTSTPSEYYFAQFEPNNQMSLYTLAGQVIFDSPVRGVIIDAAQIAVGFSRFTRAITHRTPDQLEEWTTDLENWLNLAESYAEADYWPQNDTACDKFGGCRFRSICSKSPSAREAFLKGDFERGEKWNPLKPR